MYLRDIVGYWILRPLNWEEYRMFITRCIWLTIALVATPAFSQADVWEDVSNFRGWTVSKLSVSGVSGTTASDLEKGLELSSKEANLYEQNLKRDIDRIRLYMARHGYPYCSVTPTVVRVAEKREVNLTLDVIAGPPVLVAAVELAGIPEHLMDRAVGNAALKKNDIFSDGAMESYRLSILKILNREGYARASVTASTDWIDTTTARVNIAAVPGNIYYFNDFIIQGVSDDLIELSKLVINIDRGERYEPKAVVDARDNLTRLALFSQIKLSLEDSGADSLDMLVDLKERKHRTIEVAGGYWSDEKLNVRLKWRHSNLFRRGRGTSFEISYSQFKRYGAWSAWWPALFGSRVLGMIQAGYNNLNEESYEKTAPGIGVSLGYVFSRNSAATVGYYLERASYTIKTEESDEFEDPKGLVGFLGFRISHDGTDDRINPSRGTYSWLRLEWGSPGGVSNSNYIIAEASGSIHVLMKYRMVFVANLRLGFGKPIDPSTVLLPDKRFYAGGSISHRGFSRRKLGPLDKDGKPFGGEVGTTGFIELRFPLVWKLRGAVFMDIGQVWRTRDDVTADNIEIAVGPAIRFDTPVGALRLDFGIRLTDHEKSQPRMAFHFAIGYPM